MDFGDFTPERTVDPELDPDTFTLGGQRFEVPATVGAGSFLEFSFLMRDARQLAEAGSSALELAVSAEGQARARQMLSTSEQNAQAALYQLFNGVLGERQMRKFLTVVNRLGIEARDLFGLVQRLEEAVAARPTRRQSDSGVSPSTSGLPSTGGGSGSTDTPVSAQPEGPGQFGEIQLTPRQQQKADLAESMVPVPAGARLD